MSVAITFPSYALVRVSLVLIGRWDKFMRLYYLLGRLSVPKIG